MEMKLVRKHMGENFTEGKLFINNGFECYTVEDKDRKLEKTGESAKVQNQTCIPRGKYRVVISYSNRFKKNLLEILGVPFFRGIRVHSGNSSADTEGCIIVGSENKRDDDNWVGASRVAYDKLHDKVKKAIEAGEKVWLEVV